MQTVTHDDDIYIYEVELATRNGVVRELELDAQIAQSGCNPPASPQLLIYPFNTG